MLVLLPLASVEGKCKMACSGVGTFQDEFTLPNAHRFIRLVTFRIAKIKVRDFDILMGKEVNDTIISDLQTCFSFF